MIFQKSINQIEKEIERRNNLHREKAIKLKIEPLSDNGWDDTIELQATLTALKEKSKQVQDILDIYQGELKGNTMVNIEKLRTQLEKL